VDKHPRSGRRGVYAYQNLSNLGERKHLTNEKGHERGHTSKKDPKRRGQFSEEKKAFLPDPSGDIAIWGVESPKEERTRRCLGPARRGLQTDCVPPPGQGSLVSGVPREKGSL